MYKETRRRGCVRFNLWKHERISGYTFDIWIYIGYLEMPCGCQ